MGWITEREVVLDASNKRIIGLLSNSALESSTLETLEEEANFIAKWRKKYLPTEDRSIPIDPFEQVKAYLELILKIIKFKKSVSRLYDLRLGEQALIWDKTILRVPGGWLFNQTFVPFDNEGQAWI